MSTARLLAPLAFATFSAPAVMAQAPDSIVVNRISANDEMAKVIGYQPGEMEDIVAYRDGKPVRAEYFSPGEEPDQTWSIEIVDGDTLETREKYDIDGTLWMEDATRRNAVTGTYVHTKTHFTCNGEMTDRVTWARNADGDAVTVQENYYILSGQGSEYCGAGHYGTGELASFWYIKGEPQDNPIRYARLQNWSIQLKDNVRALFGSDPRTQAQKDQDRVAAVKTGLGL